MFIRASRLAAGILFGLVSTAALAQWQAPPPAKTGHLAEGDHFVTTVDASRPGVVAVQGYGVASIAGDEDNFGYGGGWVPPLSCDTFDNRGPEDLGVFDQREPTAGQYGSICSFVGSWQQTIPTPPGGVGQFTVMMRILGGSTSIAYCAFSPCGCTTPSPQLLINGIPQDGFFSDPGCAEITYWSKTFQGAEAESLAAGGTLNFEVHWNNQPFALDWSKVQDVIPNVNIALLDGDGQKGAIKNAVEKPLRVKLTTLDPNFSLANLPVSFTVASTPPHAAGMAVGANDKATTTTYTATTDANGIASATLVLGDAQGTYTVQAKTPVNNTGEVVSFTATAQKPASVALLKDTTDLADNAPSYAVSKDAATTFFTVGLDAQGQKIGPVKCNWSTAGGGNPSTRGSGSVDTSNDPSSTTTFTAGAVGQLVLQANPTISGVNTAKAFLYITSLFVNIDGNFTSSSPTDQSGQFVPGVTTSFTDIPLATMTQSGQNITLHVLTGQGAKGTVNFAVNGSSFPGVAMNYPIDNPDPGPDMVFGTQTSVNVPFAATGDTFATLNVRDYGAYGTITVTITAGKRTYTLTPLRLPLDNGFGLPKGGWPTVAGPVDTTNLRDADDIDDQPAGQTGDGLSNYEEYRGFVVAGTHVRTNPHVRDVFVVADPQFLAGLITTVTVTTTLPNPVRYLDLSEVSGTDIAGRGVVKGDARVDPNSAGIPGVRNGGQRAARLIMQTQYEPHVDVEVQPGVIQPTPVSQFGIFGATILNDTNPYSIDYDINGNKLQGFHAQSPDGTRWSEVYESSFKNGGIATDFSNLLYFDANNQEVPPCPTIGTIPGCDEYDYAHHLVLPRIYPGYVFQLHSVPFGTGDWYSKRVVTCADPFNILDYGFTPAEMTAARSITGAHEIGHALHIDHTLICGDLMFYFDLANPVRGMIDIRPLPAFYSTDEIDQIQLRP